ncbi:N-acetyl-gamma-glutamyl-phosphate reductase [Intestinimonas butyriciproducens]|uniref:N-acetyl-gamma-glutamyl-phosphate reductase n=1 Tax=Intestinimonas butyriciproducens TaxID=1297617 RepID=UPI0009535682|nr:N-acetyl-gamma-glutamyl-phosphate reductase [Intestinimonas butyriciproducens]MBU5229536.1 N-acetyl-gamma-glutamyl-phosphate reductase [Intestinimonas butyriciproducens]OLR67113.1 N-acetyl-gamma-glutamyl-phosphate reductase [Intestinimonas butyriciproducens]
MRPKVFIDGQEGTTGLQIYERLGGREDIELLRIDPEKRKDAQERKKLLNDADLVFLCLPDAAAREAVALIENDRTKVIDASTAHRTSPGWVYGFPELLAGQRQRVKFAKRTANPGCHATGFLSAAAPLVATGVLPRDYPVTCYSLTGYSGGGKKMIAEYEGEGKGEALDSPRIYGTTLRHKHLPEMKALSGLDEPPVFCPIVDDYYKGMASCLMLHNARLTGKPTAEDLCEILARYYEDQQVVRVAPFEKEGSFLAANALAGTDRLELSVWGHEEQTIVVARFDNLGKGASGAAVQNMNLMLGFDETAGLAL